MRQNIINRMIRILLLENRFLPVKPVNYDPEKNESCQILKDGETGGLYMITVRPVNFYRKIYQNELENVVAIDHFEK